MMRNSMTLATLIVGLATSVQAYGQGPETASHDAATATQVNVLIKTSDKAHGGQCRVGTDPVLLTVLGLDKLELTTATTDVTMACHAK